MSDDLPGLRLRRRMLRFRGPFAWQPLSEERIVVVDRFIIEARDRGRHYITSLTVLPGGRVASDPLLRGLRPADSECEHGRLPGDRTPPCGCWEEAPAGA